MTCNVAPDPILTNGGIALEEAEDFKYLGSCLTTDILQQTQSIFQDLNFLRTIVLTKIAVEQAFIYKIIWNINYVPTVIILILR